MAATAGDLNRIRLMGALGSRWRCSKVQTIKLAGETPALPTSGSWEDNLFVNRL